MVGFPVVHCCSSCQAGVYLYVGVLLFQRYCHGCICCLFSIDMCLVNSCKLLFEKYLINLFRIVSWVEHLIWYHIYRCFLFPFDLIQTCNMCVHRRAWLVDYSRPDLARGVQESNDWLDAWYAGAWPSTYRTSSHAPMKLVISDPCSRQQNDCYVGRVYTCLVNQTLRACMHQVCPSSVGPIGMSQSLLVNEPITPEIDIEMIIALASLQPFDAFL